MTAPDATGARLCRTAREGADTVGVGDVPLSGTYFVKALAFKNHPPHHQQHQTSTNTRPQQRQSVFNTSEDSALMYDTTGTWSSS
ncbi:hypothetical protein ACFVH6_09485 [Spirillospora sp. NPDC127200]